MANNKTVLLLLTRSPVKGKVKTRLIPCLGEDGATVAHKELVLNTLNTLDNCDFVDKKVWLKGERSVFDSCFSTSFFISEQKSNDLGENMLEAAKQALIDYQHVIIIGSDCPDLSTHDIQQARKDLNNGDDLVLGPAEDGGYYLIGFSQLYSELFSGIEWGTEKVFNTTLQKAKDLSLGVSTLTMHYDVDTAEDYARFKC